MARVHKGSNLDRTLQRAAGRGARRARPRHAVEPAVARPAARCRTTCSWPDGPATTVCPPASNTCCSTPTWRRGVACWWMHEPGGRLRDPQPMPFWPTCGGTACAPAPAAEAGRTRPADACPQPEGVHTWSVIRSLLDADLQSSPCGDHAASLRSHDFPVATMVGPAAFPLSAGRGTWGANSTTCARCARVELDGCQAALHQNDFRRLPAHLQFQRDFIVMRPVGTRLEIVARGPRCT